MAAKQYIGTFLDSKAGDGAADAAQRGAGRAGPSQLGFGMLG